MSGTGVGNSGGSDGQGFSFTTLQSSTVGTGLNNLLMCDTIQPGYAPSYQLCKEIFLYHPLGVRMATAPIEMAQSQAREIAIPESPEDDVKRAFQETWDELGCDRIIANVAALARVYGISAVVVGAVGVKTETQLSDAKIQTGKLYFNVLDPLNISGSMVLDQDPNSPNFQKPGFVTSAGLAYHPSRGCVFLNGDPIYIAYTGSAFGYTGRSVYQTVLLPLKSFIQSMKTDDLVLRKAGVIIAKIKPPGAVINGVMNFLAGARRWILREAQTDNVISIGEEDEITTLDLTNVDKVVEAARKHVLENVATGSKMPAVILNNQTYVEGFGEGSEDAKSVARWVDGYRREVKPLYDFFDGIVQTRAWSPEFYAQMQEKYPDLKGKPYNTVVSLWKDSFTATWPSLLTEPDSEKSKAEKVKFDALISLIETCMQILDPQNMAILMQWVVDCLNASETLFSEHLELDLDTLLAFLQKQQKANEDAANAALQPPDPDDNGGEPGAKAPKPGAKPGAKGTPQKAEGK